MARLDLDKLAEAEARLGEAVVDPHQWIPLMEVICAATNTTGAALLQSDNRTPESPMTPSVVEIFDSYFEQHLDVGDSRVARGVPLLLKGRVVLRDQDVFRSEADMLRDPLYANLARFGFRWWAAIAFRSGNALWALNFQRKTREGAFEDEELAVLAKLSSSLTNAATLSRVIGSKALVGAMDAFDLLNEPAISISYVGKILQVNSSARSLFDSDFGIRRDRLFIRDDEASKSYERHFDRAVQKAPHLRHRSARQHTIIVRRSGKQPILIKMLRIPSDAHSAFLGARFLLILRDLEQDVRSPATLLSEIFSLSPAEARVASMIAAGDSPESIAAHLSLSRETVRNQIKAVFGKTGTHRQNELAALIARIRP